MAPKKRTTIASRLAALEAKVASDCPGKAKVSKPGKPILVTTSHRGVFFGYADKVDGETIALAKARLVVYWSPAMRGFMGLAATGPDANCRIGPAADIVLRNITSVLALSGSVAEAFERAPWKS